MSAEEVSSPEKLVILPGVYDHTRTNNLKQKSTIYILVKLWVKKISKEENTIARKSSCLEGKKNEVMSGSNPSLDDE